jgi:hypothetical protein
MRRTDMAPPSGWIVTPPLVASGIRHWTFGDAVRDVMQHAGYSRAEASMRVENENALRCLQLGAENFVYTDNSFSIPAAFPAPLVAAVKPHIPVTLLAVDTSPKAYLAARAIERCLEQATFDSVKLLTTDMTLPHAVKIEPINGLEGYSKFCIRDMHRYVDTSHVLVVQWDGHVLHGAAWNPAFLEYDYIGSPWLPSQHVGNGGFSLRSKRLLNTLLTIAGNEHPEDNFICVQHAAQLAQAGLKFAPYPLAARFGFEGRSWNGQGKEWEGVATRWAGQFGFHSFLTPLPAGIDRPKVFHHSGDMGDLIYSLAAIKNLGGGTLFISADNRYPYPSQTRTRATPEWCSSVASLTDQQDYIWHTQWTHALPHSTDFDLNEFRKHFLPRPSGSGPVEAVHIHPIARPEGVNIPRSPERGPFRPSLFSLHQQQCEACHPESEPWLRVDHPSTVAPIVVNRTNRYRNDLFPWRDLVTRYGQQMVFVGTEKEHHDFNAESGAPSIAFHPTANLLELARVIAGARVYIGNQSVGMAIAIGLGQNIIQESWPGSPDCILDRENACYSTNSGNIMDIAAKYLDSKITLWTKSALATFVIPTIGRSTLGRTKQSLLDQTDPDWKAVIVADNLPRALPVHDSRIVMIWTLSKLGASHFSGMVRNRGMTLADSDWIAFVDDDDRLDEHYVEWLRQEATGHDLVVFRMRYSPPREDGVAVLPRSTNVSGMGAGEVGISFAVRTTFQRQHDIWFRNEEFEDWLFIKRCLDAGARCKISEHVAYYVRH